MKIFRILLLFSILAGCSKKINKADTQSQLPPTISERAANLKTKDCPEMVQFYFVRHAEKSTNDPRDPDLSEAGHARAESIVQHLAKANISKIYATKYKRTQQTAQPLAKSLGIEIEIYDTNLTDISAILKSTERGNALIVGHSNTTPKLINKLLGTETYKKIDESVYSKMFLLNKCKDDFSPVLFDY